MSVENMAKEKVIESIILMLNAYDAPTETLVRELPYLSIDALEDLESGIENLVLYASS